MIGLRCGEALVGGSIRVAATFGSRFMGLMFKKHLQEDSGLLLMPCGSIHMCFMRMRLDIVYMDAFFRVLAVQKGLKPWRLGMQVKGAQLVLELPEGAIGRYGIEPGMTMTVEQPAAADKQTNRGKREIHGYQRNRNCCES